jgi:hypothetical protein
MNSRRTGVAAAAVAALLVLSACSGPSAGPTPAPSPTWIDLSEYDAAESGSGLALLSPADARDEILRAMATAPATTSIVFREASGRTLDIALTGDSDRFTAEIMADGETTSIVVDGAEAAVRPSASVAASAGTIAGEVACVAAGDPLVTRWAPLLDAAALIAEMTEDASGLGAPADGTLELLLGEDGTAGALEVAASGAALPIRLVRSDEAGSLEVLFTDWGQAPDVALPPDC